MKRFPSGFRSSTRFPNEGFEKPARDVLSGEEARKIRNRVVKQHLLPAGFVQSHASTFVRRVGEIVQAVNSQTMTWGGKFTVNLGLHYTFTPARPDHRKPWPEFDHLDCSLQGRIGFFLPEGLDTWFPFGSDPDPLYEKFMYSIKESIRALDEYTAKLKDPASLLSGVPDRFVHPFWITYPSIFFSTVEMRLGRLDDAERRLREPAPAGLEDVYRPMHDRLLEEIAALRREGLSSKDAQRILTWVTD